jgi:CO/xanthine dehydrogenase Mo-binding subunit
MYIGNEINRIDALEKVLGKPVYAEDISTKGALFGCVFRSTRPHALIRKIDTRAAMALPGIEKILSCKDIPGENLFGAIKKDQFYLAQDRVRYIGEPILIVLGETEEVARKASQLIDIEYGDIEIISDPFVSRDSKTLIHEKGNLLSYRKVLKGDIEKGFQEADVIIEHTYKTTWLDHAFMETEAGIGYPDSNGRIVVVSSTQNIHYKRKEISRLLAIPEEKIKVVQATTGGGFGGKLDVTVEGFLALSVYHTKRPVAMRFTREESFLSNTKRHPLYIEYKTGAKKDGAITAVKVSITGDTGPFASYGETVCLRAAIHATGPYEIPNVHVDSRMFYTNNPVSGAMRGFGIPQLAFAHESQMDEVASMFNLDPLDIRIKNALKKGSLTATSQILRNSVGIIETLKKVEPYWRKRTRENEHTGFGLGCMYYGIGNTGVSNPANAYLNITGDGKIALHTGACEIGQGSDTVLIQILQEALGLEMEDIMLVRGDTDTSKDAGSSSASRQTYISGGAVFDAAKKMRQYLNEKGFYKGSAISDIYASETDKKLLEYDGFFDPPTTPVDPETSKGAPYATYAFATHMTEVEVEQETGFCRVKKVYAAHDVGRAINLKNIRGQICGGIAMGVGFALMEEFVPKKSESFDNYYMPTSMDMPDVEVFIVEDREPTGPFGAKGVGEPALIPQAASIVNAIKDAAGVRAYELPCHIERLKKLIEDKKLSG